MKLLLIFFLLIFFYLQVEARRRARDQDPHQDLLGFQDPRRHLGLQVHCLDQRGLLGADPATGDGDTEDREDTRRLSLQIREIWILLNKLCKPPCTRREGDPGQEQNKTNFNIKMYTRKSNSTNMKGKMACKAMRKTQIL